MPRFQPTPQRPEPLLASVLALAAQSNRLALDAAMEAARADARGDAAAVIDGVCRLAVGAGVTAGEITWLVSELEAAGGDAGALAEAAVAVAGMESCARAVAQAVEQLADRDGAVEISASAEALRRVSAQLAALLGRLQPVL